MLRKITGFLAQEEGAVTVDWVVLTAAIVLMGAAVVIPIATGTSSLSSLLGGYIDDVDLGY